MSEEEKMIELIKSNREGILQSDVRKNLKIDSKKCSRLVSKLMKKHQIRREPELAKGRNTFRLYSLTFSGPSEKHKKLLAKGKFSPCTGCTLDCVPETCYPLNEWVYDVIEEEY
jgi:Lrp/AsnC family leucine-responsive transcriptional regulator